MSLAKPILQAIETIVQSTIDNAPYDKSYMGQVVSVHPETNSCSVRVNGNIYDKVPLYGGAVNVGSSIRIIIPNNQASQMYALSNGVMYPVGSIFMSCTHDTVEKVSQALGGTWVAWGSGRVPVSYKANDIDFDTIEKTGGWKNIQQHHHDVSISSVNIATGDTSSISVIKPDGNTATSGIKGAKTGASEGNNISGNLQPYIVCYMWKRIS